MTTTELITPCAYAQDKIMMATNHTRAENVALPQEIGEVAAIISWYSCIILDKMCGTALGS